MIEIHKLSDGCYDVTVYGKTKTTHRVTLSADYHHQLTGGKETEERLIQRSFEFLLRHEPNTAILRSFDLPLINQYFPDFEKEIGGSLGET